jgi:hypothetical protein
VQRVWRERLRARKVLVLVQMRAGKADPVADGGAWVPGVLTMW